MSEKRIEFCINCRKKVKYELVTKINKRFVKGKEYEYETIVAHCLECGEEMSLPGLIDYETKQFDKAYREAEGLVSIENIENLMRLYNLGKAPMSTALGFGEITITRYLAGQMPSKEYSNIIKRALTEPDFMKDRIEENKSKLGDSAYKKAKAAIEELQNSFRGVSKKMISAIAYIFAKMEEVTPLALQKLLYFSQGINLGVNKMALFSDDCEAWPHGPVYPNVYQLFKEFKYNPIDDSRYVIFDLAKDKLNSKEKVVLNSVIETFGMYSGKVLEQITHGEEPWKEAREGLGPADASNAIISKTDIKNYFSKLNEKLNLSDKGKLDRYIAEKLVDYRN